MTVLMTPDRIETLRLHTDKDGCIWYGDDDSLGTNSFLEVQDFFGSNSNEYNTDSIHHISLLGIKSNAKLIVALQRRRAAKPELNKQQQIQLFSPSIIATQAMRNNPEEVLQNLWQPNSFGALAGLCHAMDNNDFCSYFMTSEIGELDIVPEIVTRIAPYHPAWPAIAYLKYYDINSACKLLTEIMDPRWYRHPFRPNRCSRLFSYLGLTPQNIKAYLSYGKPDRHYERAKLAISTWFNADKLDNGFLWRYYIGHSDQIKGLLRSTQRFISFLQTVWLSNISYPHPEMSFSKAIFFKDTLEELAFEKFRTTWKVG